MFKPKIKKNDFFLRKYNNSDMSRSSQKQEPQQPGQQEPQQQEPGQQEPGQQEPRRRQQQEPQEPQRGEKRNSSGDPPGPAPPIKRKKAWDGKGQEDALIYKFFKQVGIRPEDLSRTHGDVLELMKEKSPAFCFGFRGKSDGQMQDVFGHQLPKEIVLMVEKPHGVEKISSPLWHNDTGLWLNVVLMDSVSILEREGCVQV